ncbi:phosphodiester glycosidase family protein [Arcicella aquatica]|uniref:Phosphodiester glycosidase family protein n=1 Tax=Arcicella aquatica TaxID=217141 RepID=A0ABU5QUM4_9BACT|nr:phosphodiester glycosidase family protein [Arcicella aquatica]MEA5260817.1 phosphodiester glycosidase family protein [Arcicella aquatica]
MILKTIQLLFILLIFEVNCKSQNSVNDLLIYKKSSNKTVKGLSIEINQIKINNTASTWNGLQFVWLKIPINNLSFTIEDLGKSIEPRNELSNYEQLDDIVITNGGFYDDSKKYDGLVKINNVIRSNFKDWEQGGFLLQSNKEIMILPISFHNNLNLFSYNYILQSKPIVVDNGKNVVFSNSYSRSNRIGIGFDNFGNLLIVIAYNDDGYAMSLYELGELLKTKDINTDTFLALDGGPNVSLYIPKLNNFFVGTRNRTYIANILHIKK